MGVSMAYQRLQRRRPKLFVEIEHSEIEKRLPGGRATSSLHPDIVFSLTVYNGKTSLQNGYYYIYLVLQ